MWTFNASCTRALVTTVQMINNVRHTAMAKGPELLLVCVQSTGLSAWQDMGALTNGHAGWDGVRVDDEVWNNAILGPGHVLLGVCDPNGALLPMPAGKLVTHLRYPDGAHLQ